MGNIVNIRDLEIEVDTCDYIDNPLEEREELKKHLIHSKYAFPNDYKDVDFEDCNSFEERVNKVIKENEQVFYISLYDHSGLAFSVVEKGFKGGWDSGLLGFIIAPKDLKEKYIKGCLEEFQDYTNGNVYGYNVDKITSCKCCGGEEERENIGACCGFFGFDPKKNGLLDNLYGEMDFTKEEKEAIESELSDYC